MSLLSNKRLLLSFLAILLGIKFVLQPILEWQNTKQDRLQRQHRQLTRGVALLEDIDNIKQKLAEKKQQRITLSNALAGNDADATAFQLRVQKLIDELLAKNDLTARNSDWLEPLASGGLEEHRVELALTGNQKNFIQFLLDIEQLKPKLAITQFSNSINKMASKRKRLGKFNGRIVLSGYRSLSSIQPDGSANG